MKKEVIIAIAIGFGIGLIATFGVFNAQKSIKEASKIQSPVPSIESKPTDEPVVSQSLSLSSPLDQSIISEGKAAISGTAAPNSLIVVLGEKGEKVVRADKKGNFETDILLVSGENEIEVQAITDAGEKISKTVTVVYSTVEI